MKIRNLALALMLGAALSACQKGQDTAAADAAAQQAAAAQQLSDAQAAAATAEKNADQARKDAAAAEKRAKRAEQNAMVASAAPAVCADCGTVTAINTSQVKPDGSGVGAVLGAAAGGVAGHQVGGGRGKDVATVLGALAGAYGGNQAEKAVRAQTVYTVDIQMDAGGSRSITVKDAGGLAVGSKVRVSGDTITPRG